MDQMVQAIGRDPADPGDPGDKTQITQLEPAESTTGSSPTVISVGNYELLEKIGEGGMGAVYKARHTKLDKIVALKVLPPKKMQDNASLTRFAREMRAVGKIDHPNIVRAMDADEENGTHFLVMEYLPGIDLSQLVKQLGPLPIAETCELIRQAAVGLNEAHDHGMVHRDIKPSNLMLCAAGRRQPPVVKILDMGLALLAEAHQPDVQGLTGTGQVMGTLDYMAPEQGGDSKSVDIRADLYALGASLYKLLTGETVYHGEQYQTLMQKVTALASKPAPPIRECRADISPELAALVHRLLEKDPNRRFATPDEVARALAPFAAGANLAALLSKVGCEKVETTIVDAANSHATPSASAADGNRRPHTPCAENGTRSVPTTIAAPQTKLASPQPPRQRRLLIAASVLALGPVLYFGGILLKINTAGGTVVLTIDQPEIAGAEVFVDDQKKITITTDDDQQPVEISVDRTKGKLKVVKGGFETFVTDFEVKSRGKTPIKVHLEPLAVAKREQPAPSHTADPDRRAAEWVLSIGGSIRVGVGDQGRDITALADLPNDSIRLTRVDLNNNQKVTDAGLAHFKDCKNLTLLYLQGTRVSDAGLTHFQDCKNLTTLSLASAPVSDSGLAHFKDCKNLTLLDLNSTQVTDAGLAHFKDCKNLTHLNLTGTPVTEAGLAHFQDCKNLTELNLGVTQVTDAGLAHFQDCKNLTALNLNNTRVSDAGLELLASLPNLSLLQLLDTRISAGGFANLKAAFPKAQIEWSEPNHSAAEAVLGLGGSVEVRVKGHEDDQPVKTAAELSAEDFQVRRVSLASVQKPLGDLLEKLAALSDPEFDRLEFLDLSGQPVADKDMANVKRLTSLTELTLARTQVSDAGLAHLKDLKNLRRLVLDGCTIGDQGLAHLNELPDLTELTLARTQVSDAGLAHLKDLKTLRRLVLDGCTIRGQGLAHLKELPELADLGAGRLAELKQLQKLSLAGSGVSDKALPPLGDLTNLRELDLTGTKVTASGIAKLKEALPNCKIISDVAGSDSEK